MFLKKIAMEKEEKNCFVFYNFLFELNEKKYRKDQEWKR